MRGSLKYGLFTVLFSTFVFIYLSLPYLSPPMPIAPDGLIFGKGKVGVLFLIVLLMTAALILTTVLHCGSHIFRKVFFKKNKIGEMLVSRGLITPDELAAALSTRKLKIGAILMKNVLLAENRSDRVPVALKNNYLKMCDVLMGIGFSVDDDLQWALSQKEKRPGAV